MLGTWNVWVSMFTHFCNGQMRHFTCKNIKALLLASRNAGLPHVFAQRNTQANVVETGCSV